MDFTPLIPENAPFTPAQRQWLNGYLAGLLAGETRASGAATPDSGRAPIPLLILFGSQTGTAEQLARRVATEARARGCEPRVMEAAAHGSIDWTRETNLLVVTSTYGDGEMPDNARDFWLWLQGDAARPLDRLGFSVLALGDSNYPEFCAAGRNIDERLGALGARRIHPRADCDVDYEAAAKGWIDSVLAALTPPNAAGPKPSPTGGPGGAASPPSTGFGKARPFPARLLANRRLNGEGSEKETRHFEISLEGSSLSYEAGDALGVVPSNCPALVEEIIALLGGDGEEGVPMPGGGETSLRRALATACDITRPGGELLQRLGAHHPEVRTLLSPDRKEELRRWL
ncbi:MAG TPA: sulfite reductase subunit alpha, partial [Verrucomicrobiales bacterium]|nr:sulfite reductase subunit alpha [Verrucomicrobiales bacterium]